MKINKPTKISLYILLGLILIWINNASLLIKQSSTACQAFGRDVLIGGFGDPVGPFSGFFGIVYVSLFLLIYPKLVSDYYRKKFYSDHLPGDFKVYLVKKYFQIGLIPIYIITSAVIAWATYIFNVAELKGFGGMGFLFMIGLYFVVVNIYIWGGYVMTLISAKNTISRKETSLSKPEEQKIPPKPSKIFKILKYFLIAFIIFLIFVMTIKLNSDYNEKCSETDLGRNSLKFLVHK